MIWRYFISVHVKESFISRAKENLAVAEATFAAGQYNACANRAYYAAFHAAIAALMHFGHTPSIDHASVRAGFIKYLINEEKIFPASMTSMLRQIMEARSEADYSIIGISRKTAQGQFKMAKQFVETVLSTIDTFEYRQMAAIEYKDTIGMNFKQIELAEGVIQALQAAYPEVKHISYSHDPADKQIVWINLEVPLADEDEEGNFRSIGRDLANEITDTYGYDFFVMFHNPLRQISPYERRQTA